MVNKKILISCLLIFLVAISVSAVSAADDGAAIAAADDSAVAAGNIIYVDGDDDVAVFNAMNQSSDGDIIELGDIGYTFNNPIEVTKQLIFHGENATIYANGSNMPDGVFVVKTDGSGTVFQGLSFINIDDPDNYLYLYNGMLDKKGKSVKTSIGIAINLDSAADDVFIDECYFKNWFNCAIGVNSANYATISNSQFCGGSATFINNIPDGPKDRGTYHISVMSSRGTTVDSCIFADTVCDGVSIAGGSYDSTVINNIFVNNAFSIYFGGKATEGTLIANNTFLNCGWFESPVYGENGTTGEFVAFYDLPVISVQKSSDSFAIVDNTFYARNGNMLIKALEGSTAHGGESNIGNITICDNTVLPMDQLPGWDEKIVMASVFLTYIETYNDVITPIGAIDIANNTLNGARAAVYWTQKWGDDLGNVHIVAADVPTTIAITSLKNSTIQGALKDFKGKAVAGETIHYVSALAAGTVETDFDGSFIIEDVDGIVELTFEAVDNYLGTTAIVDVAPSTTQKTSLVAENIFADYYGVELVAVLVNGVTGNVIEGADVTFSIGDAIYNATTNEFGEAVVPVSDLAPGVYPVTASYAGDSGYKSSDTSFNVTVNKITTAISAYYDNETNEVVGLLFNAETGLGISGANVAVNINGVKTTLKSKNGYVRVSLGDVDPNDFTATISYYGNSKFLKSSTKIKAIPDKVTTRINAEYDSETDKIVVTMTNTATDKLMNGANVAITVNGVKTTLKIQGYEATVSTADLVPGVYSVVSSYYGNSKYTDSTSTINIVKV